MKAKFVLATTLLITTIAGSGCGRSDETHTESINAMLSSSLHTFIEDSAEQTSSKNIVDYSFIGAKATESNVNFYGVATFDTGSEAYTVMEYKNPYGENYAPTFDSLKEIISTQALCSVKLKEVPCSKVLNSAVSKHIQPRKSTFYKDHSVVFDITKPVIDKEKGVAVFRTKTYVSTFEIPSELYGTYVPDENTKYNNYIITNEVYVQLSPAEIRLYESSPETIYTKFTSAVERHQNEIYLVKEVEVEQIDEVFEFKEEIQEQ